MSDPNKILYEHLKDYPTSTEGGAVREVVEIEAGDVVSG